jgi:NADH dehydrogenase
VQRGEILILVTGGTGFIGQALIRHLVAAGYRVRTLIRPSERSPRLPRGVPVEVAVAGINDERGLRAAMVGVDTVYHLVGGEHRGPREDLMAVDVRGARTVVEAAADANVDRFFYISHLGADRASAFPVLKAKAIAEDHIKNSGVDYTILRSAVVYGLGDRFTTRLARSLYGLPFIFLMPGDGETRIQPLWIEDLVTCLAWALDDDGTRNRTYELGGPEFLTFRQVLEMMMHKMGIRRVLVPIPPPYLRALTVVLEYIFPFLPLTVYWLDYLATDRTCSLDTIPHIFNLMPSRFSRRLDYLETRNWRREFWRSVMGRDS